MERKTNILLFFFAAVALITLFGFFKSYLKYLPEFSRFPPVVHIHFLAFSAWLTLLILQSLLIKQKKTHLHRKVGKLSYFLAPVLVITIAILSKLQIERDIAVQNNNAPVSAFIAVIDITTFSLFYLLSMIHRKNMRWHVAFLIAATLVVLNPGLSRILNQIQYGLGIITAVLLPFVVSLSIIGFEKIKLKKPIMKSPYFLRFHPIRIFSSPLTSMFTTSPRRPFLNIKSYYNSVISML